MSWVKKFQEGGKSTKQYGHLIINGIDLGNSEEMYNAFARHAQRQDIKQGKFYDQWLEMLRNGDDVEFGNGNTVNAKPNDMSERRAGERSNWTRFWDDVFDTDRNQFSNAVATARRFTFAAPKSEDTNSSKKTSHYNKKASFDYLGTGKDSIYQKDNPGNIGIIKRFGSYLDWLENPDTWNKSNEFTTAITDDQAQALRAWYQQFTGDTPEARRSAAQAAIDTALDAVYNSKGGYQNVPENYRDLFAYFNIGDTQNNAGNAQGGNTSDGISSGTGFINPDGSINHGLRTSNGSFRIQKGNGAGDNSGYYTNWNGNTSTPYIITRNDWDTLGLNGDYEFLRNGVIYNGRIWTPEELSTQTGNPLYGIMERVKAINADTSLTGQERFNRLSQLVNWYGKESGYNQFDWNPDSYYTINPSLRSVLNGYKNLSLYDASKSFGFEPGVLLGAYDNSIAGTENWGLRNPFYLMRDQNDRFIALTADQLSQMFPQNVYNPYSSNSAFDSNSMFTNWIDLMNDGRYFGLAFTTQGTDRDSRTGQLRQYQIYEGQDGNFYHKKNNNELVKLDPDLVEWIRQGNRPNNKQMDTGKLGKLPLSAESGGARKNGGKINAFQIGGSFEGGPNGVQQINVEQSPLQNASYLQDSLTEADWKEISAAGLDLSGAIAGLIPGGSVYTAGSGLVSTGLYLSAAKDRKGKTDASDWGQAALSTILDAVSLLPYVGEAGKLAKIGKTVSRVAVPLGKVFNMIGLAHLVPTLTKNPKDWTSDDLIALSTGITAALNVGHGAHTVRGESKLASEISRIRGAEGVPEFKYKYKMKVGETPTDIELTSGEVASIVDKNNKTPGETLKQILKNRGVADDQLGNPTELLRQFGFEVGNRRSLKKDNKIKATAHETPKPETYNDKTIVGSVLDQFSPWSSGVSRRSYIDANMSDPRVRAKIEALAAKRGKPTSSTTERAINDEITTTTYNREFEDPRLRRAYSQSLMRLGDEDAKMTWNKHIWSGAEANPTTTETIVKRNPTNAQIEAASNFSYPMSDTGIQMSRAARENPSAMTRAALEGLPEVRTLAEATGFNPNVSRQVRLGAASMSNKEIADWANNVKKKGVPAGDEPVTVDDVVELLNSLPTNRRWGLIQYFRNNTTGKNTIEAAARFLPRREKGTTTIRDIRTRINNVQATKNEDAKSAFDEARDIASNLVALRESKDPMTTLRLLSQKPNFDERAFAHSEEFREALEYAKAHGKYAKMSPKQKRQYDFELEQLMEGRNLLFKKGGKVVKAQNGIVLDPRVLSYLQSFNNSSEAIDPDTGIQSEVSVSASKMNTPRGPLQAQVPQINTNLSTANSDLSSDYIKNVLKQDSTTRIGGLKNKSRYSDYNLDSSPYITAGINAGLAALDYGSMAWGRRKIHDITERAIKDSIYKQTVPQLQTLPVTTPLEDRLAKMYESHIGRMKLPQTSDAVTNTSLEFTDDAQAMQGLSQAVGQKSAKVTQLQQANQQTMNQQQQYYANAENDLRQRVAGAIMNLGQNDASLVAQTAQSIQNLAREWRTKFDNANQQFNLFQYQNKINELNRQADADWLNQVQTTHPDIWAQWDAADQSKYDHDFNTWAMSQNGVWNKLEKDYQANRDAISEYVKDAYLHYRLNDPFLENLYRDRPATSYKSSGGKITTKRQNRYKNEPSEDIWIEQNKSTHKLVAKLNDNIIKTFLKTLK